MWAQNILPSFIRQLIISPEVFSSAFAKRLSHVYLKTCIFKAPHLVIYLRNSLRNELRDCGLFVTSEKIERLIASNDCHKSLPDDVKNSFAALTAYSTARMWKYGK